MRTGQWIAALEGGRLEAQLIESVEGDVDVKVEGDSPASGFSQGWEEGSSIPASPAIALRLSLPWSPVSAVLRLNPTSSIPCSLCLLTHSGGPSFWRWPSWPGHAMHVQSTGQTEEYVALSSGSDVLAASCDNDGEDEEEEEEEEKAHGDTRSMGHGTGRSASGSGSGGWSAIDVDVGRCDGGQFLLRGKLLRPIPPPSLVAETGAGVPSPAGGPSDDVPGWFVLDPCCDSSAVSVKTFGANLS